MTQCPDTLSWMTEKLHQPTAPRCDTGKYVHQTPQKFFIAVLVHNKARETFVTINRVDNAHILSTCVHTWVQFGMWKLIPEGKTVCVSHVFNRSPDIGTNRPVRPCECQWENSLPRPWATWAGLDELEWGSAWTELSGLWWTNTLDDDWAWSVNIGLRSSVTICWDRR